MWEIPAIGHLTMAPGPIESSTQRIPQINQLLLHFQDRLICIIETKEAGLPGSNNTIIRAPNQHQVAHTKKVLPPYCGIGMVSFPIDQGQEAASIEVQVIVVGIMPVVADGEFLAPGAIADPIEVRPHGGGEQPLQVVRVSILSHLWRGEEMKESTL